MPLRTIGFMKTQKPHNSHQKSRFIQLQWVIFILCTLFTFQAKSKSSVHIYGDVFRDGFLTVNGIEAGTFREGVHCQVKFQHEGTIVIKVFGEKPRCCEKMLVKHVEVKADTQYHFRVTQNQIISFNPALKSPPFSSDQYVLEETDDMPIVRKQTNEVQTVSDRIVHFVAPSSKFYHIYVNDELIGALGPDEHLKYVYSGPSQLAVRVKSDRDYIRTLDVQAENEQYFILTPKYIGETYTSKGKKLLSATGKTMEALTDSH